MFQAQCRFKYLGNSSGVRDITLLVKCCLFLLSDPSSQTCLGCVWFQNKSQPHKTFAFCLGDFSTPGSQGWCHVTRGLSWGACGGNRKQCMLQLFLSCQALRPHDRISDADFSACPSTGYQFQLDILNMPTYCCVRLRRFIVSCRIHAKSADFARREDFANAGFPRQTKRRQKDAKIPDSYCLFLPRENVNLFLSCYSFSIPWLIILFFGVLWKRSLLLSTCIWHW